MEEVKLFGAWPSPYVYKAIWALELKGVCQVRIRGRGLGQQERRAFEVEHDSQESASAPSQSRLLFWSILKRPLLPKDPYQRALARFWIKFIEQKEMVVGAFYLAAGAAKDVREEVLRIIEDEALGGDAEKAYLGGDEIGMADLAMGVIAKSLGVIEQVFGHKVLEEHEFPRINKWIRNFRQNSAIKNNLPDSDQMLDYYKKKREVFLAAKAQGSCVIDADKT